jgi:uroporphyrinogen-III synthase
MNVPPLYAFIAVVLAFVILVSAGVALGEVLIRAGVPAVLVPLVLVVPPAALAWVLGPDRISSSSALLILTSASVAGVWLLFDYVERHI